jgi:hypothetical protein
MVVQQLHALLICSNENHCSLVSNVVVVVVVIFLASNGVNIAVGIMTALLLVPCCWHYLPCMSFLLGILGSSGGSISNGNLMVDLLV